MNFCRFEWELLFAPPPDIPRAHHRRRYAFLRELKLLESHDRMKFRDTKWPALGTIVHDLKALHPCSKETGK